jgi:hypothetical protein
LDPLAFETERTAVDGQWHAFPNARPLNGAAVEEFRWSVNSAHAEGLVLAAVAVDQSDR